MRTVQAMSYLIVTIMATGCANAPWGRQAGLSCPFRLDYEIAMKPKGEAILVTVRHIVENQSESEVLIFDMPDRGFQEYNAHIDKSGTLDEDAILDAEIGMKESGGTVCCTTERSFFRLVRPGQRIYWGREELQISSLSTSLTYRASFAPCRDGREFGLNAWTGTIEGSEITIPVIRGRPTGQ